MKNLAQSKRLVGIFATLALLMAACGGGSGADAQTLVDDVLDTTTSAAPTTQAPSTTVAPTTTTLEPMVGDIQESFVGTVTAPYSGEAIVDGEVRVYFNNGSNGMLVAIYHGDGLADPTGLCPGSSLQANGFEFISNAPATPGACDAFSTELGSVRVCTSNVWLYETHIPNDSAGVLWGSLEMNGPTGIVGMTGQATNQSGTPVIDYDADDYTISPMFTSDGATEITCDAATV